MPRTRRPQFDSNYFYHILNRGNNKINIFLNEKDKTFFLEKFKILISNSNVYIDTFCIMDNHFHIELNPSDSDNISKIIQCLCTSYALYYNKKYEKIGHVFQDRYKSKQINTLQGLLNVRKYIQENPVKAGYCDKPENYRWLWSKDINPWPGTVPDGDSP